MSEQRAGYETVCMEMPNKESKISFGLSENISILSTLVIRLILIFHNIFF